MKRIKKYALLKKPQNNMQEALSEYLAIDFGTTNSVVYVYKNGGLEAVPSGQYGKQGSNLFPSFVEYAKDKAVVGNSAKSNFGRNNRYVVSAVKRILGLTYAEYLTLKDKSIFGCEVVEGSDGYPRFEIDKDKTLVSPIDVATEIFKTIKNAADVFCNITHRYAYVTVPANFKDHQRSAIREAAQKSGLIVEKLITEPTAAAMSWCFDNMDKIKTGEKILIYDFGGGTFDVSLLEFLTGHRFNIINVGGDPKLGGNDVDSALMDYVLDLHHLNTEEDITPYKTSNVRKNRIRRECEEMKIDITNRCKYKDKEEEFFEANTNVSHEVAINTRGDSVTIFNKEFSAAIRDKVQETIDITINTLRNSPPSGFTPYNIRHVILVGGSSHLHLIKHLLHKKFIRADFHDVNPDEAVAQGCLRLLMHMKDPSSPVTVKEKIVISYGILSGEKDVALFLKKGDYIPTPTRVIPFTNSNDNEKEYFSTIYQWMGDLKDAEVKNNIYIVPVEECTEVSKLRFKNPYPQPKGMQNLAISCSLDIGGTLKVICKDRDKDVTLSSESFNNAYGSILHVCYNIPYSLWIF